MLSLIAMGAIIQAMMVQMALFRLLPSLDLRRKWYLSILSVDLD